MPPRHLATSPPRHLATFGQLFGMFDSVIDDLLLPRRHGDLVVDLAERFLLTAWTERTDRVLIFSQPDLRAILAEYEAHFPGGRPHRRGQLHPPRPAYPAADLSREQIKRTARPRRLINEYERAA